MPGDRPGNTATWGNDRVKLLSLVDIFEPLSREEIENIKWEHLNTTVEQGVNFFTPMDLCETLFILHKGRIRLYRATPGGRQFTLAVLQSGTVFGEMALTGRRLRSCYAEALEESEVSAMCRADVERLILDKPAVGLQLVHLLSDRLSTYETRLQDLGLKEVPARLASLILMLVEGEGIRTAEGYRIPTRYTHHQLATMIGMSRESGRAPGLPDASLPGFSLGESPSSRVCLRVCRRALPHPRKSLAAALGEQDQAPSDAASCRRGAGSRRPPSRRPERSCSSPGSCCCASSSRMAVEPADLGADPRRLGDRRGPSGRGITRLLPLHGLW